jgi:PAS domain S-box-containing protein
MPHVVPHARSLRIAGFTGWLVLAAGLLVMFGWLTDERRVLQLASSWTPMVPATAVSFVLAGGALVAITRAMARAGQGDEAAAERWRKTAIGLGAVVAVIGARRLVYYTAGWTTTGDMLGFVPFVGPGQMAFTTAVGFFLAGVALVVTAQKRFFGIEQALAGLVFFIGWAGLVRYLYGGSTDSWFFLMAANTAFLFAVLGLGIFFARPDAGLVRVWNGQSAGSTLARGVLPTAILLPVVAGWVRLEGERAGWYGFETGLTLFALSNVVIFAALTWHTASRLHREDQRRMEAEQAGRGERMFSQGLIDSLPGVFYLYDREGRFLRWNNRFEVVTGYEAAEIARMRPQDFFPAEEHAALTERVGRVFTEGRADLQGNFLSKDGALTPYYFTGVRVELNGEPCLAGVGIDISERLRAERKVYELNAELEQRVAARTAELEAKNRELETFTYSVSHDLKAPLRGIDGYSRLLLEDYEDKLDEEGRRFLHSVRRAAGQMGQLIDDLLAYSQLERRAVQPVRVALRSLVADLLTQYEEEVTRRGVALSVDVPDIDVWADLSGLTQSLRNLIDNALKFTKSAAAARIEIGGREEVDSCTIWVRDNGVGFEMKFAERIFDIFQRLHRAEDFPGTGIGLAIVRKAMERMGGRAWALSLPGQGATFYLTIPKRT